jgi:hypothetical protein
MRVCNKYAASGIKEFAEFEKLPRIPAEFKWTQNEKDKIKMNA